MPTATQTGLSKMDIKALKQADRVCFYHSKDGGAIRCVKEVKQDGPFDEREKEYRIECQSSVYKYDPLTDHGAGDATDRTNCFAMTYARWQDSVWSAVKCIVREGDELRLKWTADPCNGYMRDNNKTSQRIVHFDTLHVVIRRNDSTLCNILIEHSHCENNTARMIRGL